MTSEEYLKEHGITEKGIVEFELTADEKEIHIPVKDAEGNIIFYKHRNLHHDPQDSTSNKYRYDSGSSAALFNYHAVKEKSYMVICEGEIDCIRLNQEGIPAVSSTGGANTFLPEWAKLLEHNNIFICYDNDEAGRKGTDKVLSMLPEAKIVTLSEGKDVCEYFATGKKKEDFIQLLREAKGRQEAPEFRWISGKELGAMEFPEEEWLIDRVIYKEGFCFVYGTEGVGKSFVTLSMAQAIADGKDWLGQFKVSKASKVLFIDKENPKPMLAKRIKNMGIFNENMFWLEYPERLQLADNKGEISEFAKNIASKVEREGISLIIIDSFVDLMVGNENSAADTQVFFDTLRTLIPKKAFIVLHHENKPSQGVFRSDSHRARGSSNINAQTVTQFRLEAVAKSKIDLTLKQTKARDAQKLDKFMIRMVVEPVSEGSEETKVTGFEYVGVVAGQIEDSKTAEARKIIIEAISEELNVSNKQLVDICSAKGIADRTMRRVVKKMVKDGELEELKDGRNKYYTLLVEVESAEDDE